MTDQIVFLIPNSMIDDFAIFGFIGGILSYSWYLYVERNDPRNHMSIFAGIYGVFLSGGIGALLAVIFDKAIWLSALVGLLNQVIYMSFLKAAKSGKFFDVLKEVLIRYLSGGTKP